MDAIEKRAREFHEAYERLAPQFGYETRPETREFDPESPNGRLMMAVVAALTPPEGYVAAPEDPSLAMTAAGQLFGLSANQACAVYQSMLAARPEVKP